VVCGNNNEPRVEPSGGVLGLRVESARTNEALRSEQWNNAAWLSMSSGVAAPTVTADQAVAPDGTTTAERIEVPATTSGQYSYGYQGGFSSTQRVSSFYVKGNGGSGSINLLSGSTPNACVRCNYVADSWTRCELLSSGTASTFFFVGNDSASAVCGTSNKSAVDAFVWGMQHEAGAYPTSYIPTVAASVTRNAEAAFGALPASQVGSMAVTVQVPYPSSAAVGANRRLLRTDANGSDTDRFELLWSASANVQTYVSVGSVAGASPLSALQTVPGTHRSVAWRTPGVTTANITNGTQVTAADSQAAFPDFNRVYLGVYAVSSGFELDGIVTRVCVDPSPTRCR